MANTEAEHRADRIMALIRKHLAAYPEDLFPPFSDNERRKLATAIGGTYDRISAYAIRWKLTELLKDIEEME